MRVEIYVRANASAPAVGGEFDGALVVRVVEPAESGRATEAALKAVAASMGVPRRTVHLRRGSKSRRKLVEVQAAPADVPRIQAALDRLRSGDPE
ncbi:MAG: DUF167 domain-containing protein [Actinomycetota bacterium]|nr:DUF167 domain-containing protein [Actinomycetota bacterium]